MSMQLPDPIREFIEATNAGDSGRFVAAFADDASLNDWGREFRGRDGVRAWDGSDNIGKRSHFEVVDVTRERQSDRYTVTVDVTGDGFNGRSPIEFRVRGGLIAEVRIS